MLPFTREQFLSLFGAYNEAVWPAQIVAYLLGAVVLAMVARPSALGARFVAFGLACMWAWTAISYHWIFFSTINDAALLFGALFVIQAVLLLYFGMGRTKLAFGTPRGWTAWVGWAFVAYAAIVYPLLGMATGHSYPEMPMFGITPCPVTIFTFGVFLLTTSPVPRWLLVFPFVWSLIGGSAAFLLGVPQDWLLLFSGISILLIVLRDRNRPRIAVTA